MLAEQVLALIIFISMFVLIVLDKIERHYVTLGCGALTLIGVFGIIMKSPEAVISTLNLRSIFTSGFWYQSAAAEEAVTGINWSTIIFIAGINNGKSVFFCSFYISIFIIWINSPKSILDISCITTRS